MGLPTLKLDDLEQRTNAKVKLSILMTINDFRQVQVARSLECLCRQNWKDFEVLIAHTENLQDMDKVIETFTPFLNLRAFPMARVPKRWCPTAGIKHMLPAATGEVIAIMQPEVMLLPEATMMLYAGVFEELKETLYWRINTDPFSKNGRPRFVNFKVGFFSSEGTKSLDAKDWHSNIKNVEDGEFWQHGQTLSNSTNAHMLSYYEFPWWFVSSAAADDPIWKDMPTFGGHASIDFWLLGYRNIHNYVDVCPLKFMGYHQRHKQNSDAPAGEKELAGTSIPESDRSKWPPIEVDEMIEECVLNGGINLSGEETIERLIKIRSALKSNVLEMQGINHSVAHRLGHSPPKLPMPYNINAQLI